MRLLGGNLRPRVPRTHRDVPKPQAPQQFADAPPVQVQHECLGDLRLRINPPPAYAPILLQCRPGLEPNRLSVPAARPIDRLTHRPRGTRSDSPATPSALNRCTQSRNVCRSIPHCRTASAQDYPSRTRPIATIRRAAPAPDVRPASRRNSVAVTPSRVIDTVMTIISQWENRIMPIEPL